MVVQRGSMSVPSRCSSGTVRSVWIAAPSSKTVEKRRQVLMARKPFVSAKRNVICNAATSNDLYRWPEWSEIWRSLTDSELQSVNPLRAKDMIDTGKWIFVDVRPRSIYDKAHIEGALSVPLFDDIDWSKASPMGYLRAAAYLVNGVTPVVPNESFDEEIRKARQNGKGFVFYCETGGTIDPSTNFMYGKQSRSLKASFRSLQLDPEFPIAHLDGGIFAWTRTNLPTMGEYDPGNAGRTPNIAAAPDIDENK